MIIQEKIDNINDFHCLLGMLQNINIPISTITNSRWKDVKHRSMLFGHSNPRFQQKSDFNLSAASVKYPHIYDEILRIGKLYVHHDFRSIYVNHNVVCPLHIDKNNEGLSTIISIGDYDGGALEIVLPTGEHCLYDTKYKGVCFNGGELMHRTHDVTGGDKYSLVFYN